MKNANDLTKYDLVINSVMKDLTPNLREYIRHTFENCHEKCKPLIEDNINYISKVSKGNIKDKIEKLDAYGCLKVITCKYTDDKKGRVTKIAIFKEENRLDEFDFKLFDWLLMVRNVDAHYIEQMAFRKVLITFLVFLEISEMLKKYKIKTDWIKDVNTNLINLLQENSMPLDISEINNKQEIKNKNYQEEVMNINVNEGKESLNVTLQRENVNLTTSDEDENTINDEHTYEYKNSDIMYDLEFKLNSLIDYLTDVAPEPMKDWRYWIYKIKDKLKILITDMINYEYHNMIKISDNNNIIEVFNTLHFIISLSTVKKESDNFPSNDKYYDNIINNLKEIKRLVLNINKGFSVIETGQFTQIYYWQYQCDYVEFIEFENKVQTIDYDRFSAFIDNFLTLLNRKTSHTIDIINDDIYKSWYNEDPKYFYQEGELIDKAISEISTSFNKLVDYENFINKNKSKKLDKVIQPAILYQSHVIQKAKILVKYE